MLEAWSLYGDLEVVESLKVGHWKTSLSYKFPPPHEWINAGFTQWFEFWISGLSPARAE